MSAEIIGVVGVSMLGRILFTHVNPLSFSLENAGVVASHVAISLMKRQHEKRTKAGINQKPFDIENILGLCRAHVQLLHDYYLVLLGHAGELPLQGPKILAALNEALLSIEVTTSIDVMQSVKAFLLFEEVAHGSLSLESGTIAAWTTVIKAREITSATEDANLAMVTIDGGAVEPSTSPAKSGSGSGSGGREMPTNEQPDLVLRECQFTFHDDGIPDAQDASTIRFKVPEKKLAKRRNLRNAAGGFAAQPADDAANRALAARTRALADQLKEASQPPPPPAQTEGAVVADAHLQEQLARRLAETNLPPPPLPPMDPTQSSSPAEQTATPTVGADSASPPLNQQQQQGSAAPGRAAPASAHFDPFSAFDDDAPHQREEKATLPRSAQSSTSSLPPSNPKDGAVAAEQASKPAPRAPAAFDDLFAPQEPQQDVPHGMPPASATVGPEPTAVEEQSALAGTEPSPSTQADGGHPQTEPEPAAKVREPAAKSKSFDDLFAPFDDPAPPSKLSGGGDKPTGVTNKPKAAQPNFDFFSAPVPTEDASASAAESVEVRAAASVEDAPKNGASQEGDETGLHGETASNDRQPPPTEQEQMAIDAFHASPIHVAPPPPNQQSQWEWKPGPPPGTEDPAPQETPNDVANPVTDISNDNDDDHEQRSVAEPASQVEEPDPQITADQAAVEAFHASPIHVAPPPPNQQAQWEWKPSSATTPPNEEGNTQVPEEGANSSTRSASAGAPATAAAQPPQASTAEESVSNQPPELTEVEQNSIRAYHASPIHVSPPPTVAQTQWEWKPGVAPPEEEHEQ